jgi:hypothetical protein
MRRRRRRRAVVAGAAIAGSRHSAEQQQAPEPAPAVEQPQAATPPADPADEIARLAQLHDQGALTDEEFAAAKAKALGA